MWFTPLKETSRRLFETYQLGMKLGDFRTAMFSLNLSTRFAVFEGENLHLLSYSIGGHLKNMVRQSFIPNLQLFEDASKFILISL